VEALLPDLGVRFEREDAPVATCWESRPIGEDVDLPRIHGPALAKRLAELYSRAKVITMSSFSDDSLEKRGIAKEGIVLLGKPFTPSVLLREVRQIFDATPQPSVPEPPAMEPSGGD
jgi:FixJ family two-component response regulator